MASKEKKRRRVYELDTEQIKMRLSDMGKRCIELSERLADFGTEELNKEDRSLVRFAYVGTLRTHFSEAVYCVMSGDAEHAIQSLENASELIQQLP